MQLGLREISEKDERDILSIWNIGASAEREDQERVIRKRGEISAFLEALRLSCESTQNESEINVKKRRKI